jgi:hypothetical protein
MEMSMFHLHYHHGSYYDNEFLLESIENEIQLDVIELTWMLLLIGGSGE